MLTPFDFWRINERLMSMSKTIEELYRETKEKSAPKKSDSGVRYEKLTPPERWYEKHWGIWLLLIICFPLGIILLCSSRKYSSGSKIGIALAMVCLIFYVHNSFREPEKPSTYRQSTSYTQSASYDIGYLKQGAEWTDGDTVYKNKKRVQVEIWDRKIVMADGSRLRQIFFLEGSHAGKWGYTQDSSLSR